MVGGRRRRPETAATARGVTAAMTVRATLGQGRRPTAFSGLAAILGAILAEKRKRPNGVILSFGLDFWSRGPDLNRLPPGYEGLGVGNRK